MPKYRSQPERRPEVVSENGRFVFKRTPRWCKVMRVRLDAMGLGDYGEYLITPGWAARKVAYFRTHERLCEICRCEADLHLHHCTYDRLGRELDDDLMVLCGPHHDRWHCDFNKACRRNPELSMKVFTKWFLWQYGLEQMELFYAGD